MSSSNKKESKCAGTSISLTGIQTTKAGMKGLDKEKINQLLFEASKDSLYFKHEQERDKKIEDQVKQMMKEWKTTTEPQRQNAIVMMEKARKNKGYDELARDLSSIIVHIDMDMFFAAVEMRDNPNLKDKPMAVGSNQMVATSNYVARRFGVRAGMAGFICRKLCPGLILVPCNFQKYSAVSDIVMTILRDYDSDIVVMGCDEAYLNLTDYVTKLYKKTNKDWKDPIVIENEETGEKKLIPEMWDLAHNVVEEMRTKIFEATQLTASAGIATTTMLAKICSDLNKPNGQYMLPGKSFEFIQEFVGKFDVRKVSGIGAVQEKILKAFDINTIKDLWDHRDMIYILFKPAAIDFYLRVSLGLGSGRSKNDDNTKSRGRSTSFKATNDFAWLDNTLKELCQKVETMMDDNIKGKTISFSIEKASFDCLIKNKKLPFFTSDAEIIYQSARTLLKSILSSNKGTKWRSMGVRVSQLNINAAEVINERKQSTLDKFFPLKICSKLKNQDTNIHDEYSLDSYDDGEIEYCDDDEIEPDEFICTSCNDSFTEYETFDEHVSICLDDKHNEEELKKEDRPFAGLSSSLPAQIDDPSNLSFSSQDNSKQTKSASQETPKNSIEKYFSKRSHDETLSPLRAAKMVKI